MSEPAKERPLTPRQERFVAEYLKDLNATQAAIRAGYAAKNADVQGPALLGKLGIARAVAAGKEGLAKDAGLTQERIIIELAAMATSNVTHYQVNQENGRLELAPGAPPNAMAAVSSIKYRRRTFGMGDEKETEYEVEFKLWDKPGTLKLAGRYKAVPGFFDKLEVTGKDDKPLIPAAVSDALAALMSIGIKAAAPSVENSSALPASEGNNDPAT